MFESWGKKDWPVCGNAPRAQTCVHRALNLLLLLQIDKRLTTISTDVKR